MDWLGKQLGFNRMFPDHDVMIVLETVLVVLGATWLILFAGVAACGLAEALAQIGE